MNCNNDFKIVSYNINGICPHNKCYLNLGHASILSSFTPIRVCIVRSSREHLVHRRKLFPRWWESRRVVRILQQSRQHLKSSGDGKKRYSRKVWEEWADTLVARET